VVIATLQNCSGLKKIYVSHSYSQLILIKVNKYEYIKSWRCFFLNYIISYMFLMFAVPPLSTTYIYSIGNNMCSQYHFKGRFKILLKSLGAFTKLRKMTTSFIRFVHLPVCLCVYGTSKLSWDRFSWNLIFEDFYKTVEEIQVCLKSVKTNKCSTWRLLYSYDHI
jgi:hypothetical protein